MSPTTSELIALMKEGSRGSLNDVLGVEITHAERGLLSARLPLEPDHLGPHGFVHAGTVVTIADSCAGLGCMASLPEHAVGFLTLELKMNFLRSARAKEVLTCEARLENGGRTTQVWDATVARESDSRTIALFRCTQMLLTELRDHRQA